MLSLTPNLYTKLYTKLNNQISKNNMETKNRLKPALLAAGNLATFAERVINSNAINLSLNISCLQTALHLYNAEILKLENENTKES